MGLINGIIAVYYRIDSFIVTLGTGTFLQGLTLYMTGGLTTSGVPDSLVDWIVGTRFMNVPLAFFYGLALVTVTWFVFEHTPIGVRLLFVGKSRRVAELNGISVSRTRNSAH